MLVLGAGHVGKLIARDLSQEHDVCVADANRDRLSAVGDFACTSVLDARDGEALRKEMRPHDIVVSALPGWLGFRAVRAAIGAGVNMVDISFMPEDPLSLHGDAVRSGVTVIPDAGVAPGLSNVLMGRMYSVLGPLDRALIRVGGLPLEVRPPLFHAALWSPADLMEEYTRPARIVVNGEIVEVDPLGEIFPLELPGFGPLEEFRSDGLRTLLHTVRARNMEERTVRHRGHLERMRVLREMGFLDREHIGHTLNVLAPHLRHGAERDILVMEVIGRRGDREMRYFLLDRHSEGNTAMARTTGYTATAVARWLLRGNMDAGVVPPERLGMDENAYRFILDGLARRGVRVEPFPEAL